MTEASTPNGDRDESGSSSNRWWEQYYVRYFVGTVVGAAVLLTLRQFANLHADIVAVLPSNEISGWGLAAITAAGLAYCYVASAPILTLHAVRGGLHLNKVKPGLLLLGFVTIFAALPIVAWLIGKHYESAAVFSWILDGVIFAAQIVLVVVAQWNKSSKINDFYDRLIRARRANKTAKTDYTDSYRHLREHGNAKSILILEIVLGLILISATSWPMLIAMMLLWLTPGAYVWIIASALEAHFAAVSGNVPNAPGQTAGTGSA